MVRTKAVRKFIIGKGFIRASKDGLLFGKRDGTGRHITLLGEAKRTTVHLTDPKTGNEHLFSGENNEELRTKFRAGIDEMIASRTPQKHPKYIYALPNSSFRLDLKYSEGGEVATVKPSTFRKMEDALIRIPFEDFLNGEYVIGYTSHKTEVVKGRTGYVILYKKTEKLLEKHMLKEPFFAALDKARKKIIN